jgi:hypothetical protein
LNVSWRRPRPPGASLGTARDGTPALIRRSAKRDGRPLEEVDSCMPPSIPESMTASRSRWLASGMRIESVVHPSTR